MDIAKKVFTNVEQWSTNTQWNKITSTKTKLGLTRPTVFTPEFENVNVWLCCEKNTFEIRCRTASTVLNVLHSKHIFKKMHLRIVKKFTFSTMRTRWLDINVSFNCNDDIPIKEIFLFSIVLRKAEHMLKAK